MHEITSGVFLSRSIGRTITTSVFLIDEFDPNIFLQMTLSGSPTGHIRSSALRHVFIGMTFDRIFSGLAETWI